MEGVGQERYAGMFTFHFSGFNVGKGSSVHFIRHLKNLASNEPIHTGQRG